MGKYIKDLDIISSFENEDKILVDRNGVGYSANLADIMSSSIEDIDTIRANAALGATALQEVPSEYITELELNAKGYLTLEDVQQLIKNATSRIDGGIISTTNTPSQPPTVDGIGGITENNEIIINEDMLSAGTYTLKYLDGDDNVVDNSKPITEFTI